MVMLLLDPAQKISKQISLIKRKVYILQLYFLKTSNPP